MFFKKRSELKKLIKEFEDLTTEHNNQAAACEARIHFLSCPKCGEQPASIGGND